MYSTVFLLIGAFVTYYTWNSQVPFERSWPLFAGALMLFCIFRYVGFKIAYSRIVDAFSEARSDYAKQWGNTISGTKYLDKTKSWNERIGSSLGPLALFGDWHTVLFSRIAIAIAEHAYRRSYEQRQAEEYMDDLAERAHTMKTSYSTSMSWVSLLLILAGAFSYGSPVYRIHITSQIMTERSPSSNNIDTSQPQTEGDHSERTSKSRAFTLPREVIVTHDMSISVPHGLIGVRKGQKVRLLSQDKATYEVVPLAEPGAGGFYIW